MITEILLKVALRIITLTLILMVTEIFVLRSITYSQLIELDNKHHSYRKPTISIFIITKLCFSKKKQVYVLKPVVQEEFEDTKGAIRIRILKKNREHNGQTKKYKSTTTDLQNIHIKLKIE